MRRFVGVFAALGLLLPVLCTPDAAAAADAPHCLDVTRVTAFAPRDEIYVSVTSKCRPLHFEQGDPVFGRIEVLVGSLPPRHEDLSVYLGTPDREQTIVFENIVLEKGSEVLVRLLENGDVIEVLTSTAR